MLRGAKSKRHARGGTCELRGCWQQISTLLRDKSCRHHGCSFWPQRDTWRGQFNNSSTANSCPTTVTRAKRSRCRQAAEGHRSASNLSTTSLVFHLAEADLWPSAAWRHRDLFARVTVVGHELT